MYIRIAIVKEVTHAIRSIKPPIKQSDRNGFHFDTEASLVFSDNDQVRVSSYSKTQLGS